MNNYIDHAALHPEYTLDKIIQEARVAIKHRFRGFCVLPNGIRVAAKTFYNHLDPDNPLDLILIGCIGFPFGANGVLAKSAEIDYCQTFGANEFDVVMDLALFKSGKYLSILNELTTLVDCCGKHKLKVIVEECCLTNDELTTAWEIVRDSGAYAIKTSTGFHRAGGATLFAVKCWDQLNQDTKNPLVIKASGGISTKVQANAFLEAGANILGTSNGVAILKDNYE